MRSLLCQLACFLVISGVFGLTTSVQAQPLDGDRLAARHALEIAKLELRLYRQVEYPREKRHLEATIQLTRAEVKMLRRRIRAYHPFDQFEIGKPLLVTLQNTKLALLAAELRLEDIQAELTALRRYHSDRCRLLELKVYEARARVAQIEGGGTIEIATDG